MCQVYLYVFGMADMDERSKVVAGVFKRSAFYVADRPDLLNSCNMEGSYLVVCSPNFGLRMREDAIVMTCGPEGGVDTVEKAEAVLARLGRFVAKWRPPMERGG